MKGQDCMPKFQIEWGKLALIGMLMLGGFALIVIALFTNLPDDRFAAVLALATGCITGPAGYLYGNGRLASRGEQSVPTIAPHPDRVNAKHDANQSARDLGYGDANR